MPSIIKPIVNIASRTWDKMVNLSPTGKIAASLVLKDVVGCYMYTNTAKANKKYTPEKRSDVANYDLANGIINIGLQVLLIRPIEKWMTYLSETKLMKHFFKNLDGRLASPENKSVMSLLKTKSGLVKGAVAIFSMAICQYGIKRFVSPYFSVPLGEKFQQWGLVKPKLYPGETYGKESLLDRFLFFRMFSDSQKSKKSNSFSGYFKQSPNNK